MLQKQPTYKAACHCKSVQFEVQLMDGFNTVSRCSCSFCRARGAIAVTAGLDGVTFTHGQDLLTLYQFNTKTAEHYFCSICGIYTHHRRRSDPNEFGVNVACLEGVSPFDFTDVTVHDGINHPSDATTLPPVAGTLRFIKDEN